MNKYDYGIFTGVPTNYDFRDKDVNTRNYISYMLLRSIQMFTYKNLPENISSRQIEKQLQSKGFGVALKHDSKFYILDGTLSGSTNEIFNPTQVNINNQYLGINDTFSIDGEVILLESDSFRIGVIPLLSKYCTMLVENEITMMLSNINKRNETILTSTDDVTTESAKLYLKKIEQGEISSIVGNKLFDSIKALPTSKHNSSLMDLVSFQQYIRGIMFNEIGLANNINMKKERMIESEVNQNNDSLYPLVDDMLLSRKECLEKINAKFDLNISVELNSSWVRVLENDSVDDSVDDSGDDSIDDSGDDSGDDSVDDEL